MFANWIGPTKDGFVQQVSTLLKWKQQTIALELLRTHANKEINMAKANEIIESPEARLTKNHKFPLIQEL